MSQKYEVSIKFGTTETKAEDTSASAPERSEYERFENFARALVSVPKTELDEKRKAD